MNSDPTLRTLYYSLYSIEIHKQKEGVGDAPLVWQGQVVATSISGARKRAIDILLESDLIERGYQYFSLASSICEMEPIFFD